MYAKMKGGVIGDEPEPVNQTRATRGQPCCLVRSAWYISWSWNGISNEFYSSIFRATHLTIIYYKLLHLIRGLQSLKFTN